MSRIFTYITRIYKNDPTLLRVHLSKKNLLDADIAPLLQAFADNPEAAARILQLDLNQNCFSNICIKNFINLKVLHLAHNLLTNLELENLPALTHLYVSDNFLLNLNFPSLRALSNLGCSKNQLVSIHLPNQHTANTLQLNSNNLTMAARIAIYYASEANPRLRVQFDHTGPARFARTLELPTLHPRMLQHHFNKILTTLFNKHVKQDLSTITFNLYNIKNHKLPADIISKIAKYVIGDPLQVSFDAEVEALQLDFAPKIKNDGTFTSGFHQELLTQYLLSDKHLRLREQVANNIGLTVSKLCFCYNKILENRSIIKQNKPSKRKHTAKR